ncbi:MAG: hypothetical protein OXF11_13955 [Deltaproteobacteria bacterium]|nr:hypothetical protein [Deltaproteobacteria bacterium]
MRLIPGSLAGQLALLLLLALGIAQGIAMALFAVERSEAVRHAHRDNVIARAGTVARLLRDTPPALHNAILDAASTDQARFTLTREPLVGGTGTGERAAFIARGLSVALDVGQERVRVAPPHDDTPGGFWIRDGDDHDHGHEDWREHWFAASVTMGTGAG